MSKFFNDDEEVDKSVLQNHADKRPHSPQVPEEDPRSNGGLSNDAYLNDFRNRMPYHYVEEGSDGYYYWQYGATMEIEFEISDEITSTDPVPPYVVDVRENGTSVVDEETGIASLEFGSMAKKRAEDYFTAEETNKVFTQLTKIANVAKDLSEDLKQRVEKLTQDLYSLIGQKPAEGDNYTVTPNIPFMMRLDSYQQTVIVNGTEFDRVFCLDASDTKSKLAISLADLPQDFPFVAIYKLIAKQPTLFTSLSMLPKDYVDKITIPAVEDRAKISTHNLDLDETDGYLELTGTALQKVIAKLDNLSVPPGNITTDDLETFLLQVDDAIGQFKQYILTLNLDGAVSSITQIRDLSTRVDDLNKDLTEVRQFIQDSIRCEEVEERVEQVSLSLDSLYGRVTNLSNRVNNHLQNTDEVDLDSIVLAVTPKIEQAIEDKVASSGVRVEYVELPDDIW